MLPMTEPWLAKTATDFPFSRGRYWSICAAPGRMEDGSVRVFDPELGRTRPEVVGSGRIGFAMAWVDAMELAGVKAFMEGGMVDPGVGTGIDDPSGADR